MQSLNQNLFARVKAAVSMEEGVRFCGLEVPLRGNMRCPFHDDHQPSLTLYPDNYHCWGCGVRGDVIDFVARYNQITPLEAARRLAAHAGIPVEQPAGRRVLRKKKPAEAGSTIIYLAIALNLFHAACDFRVYYAFLCRKAV